MSATLSRPSPTVKSPSVAGVLCTARQTVERFPASLLALAFRFAVATVFWKSGLTKIASWESTLALFEYEYAVPLLSPMIAAGLATVAELGGSALLVLGLGTRFAAAALLGMTLVIQVFVFPENWPDHQLWGSILAYLVVRGAGVLSLDHLIGRRLFGASAS